MHMYMCACAHAASASALCDLNRGLDKIPRGISIPNSSFIMIPGRGFGCFGFELNFVLTLKFLQTFQN